MSHSSLKIDLDDVEMANHAFATLGSISLSAVAATISPVRGYVTIASRKKGAGFSIEEHLQAAEGRARNIQLAFVPTSFSIPVLAVHSLNIELQHVFIDCVDAGGRSYQSEITVGPGMTFLVNACISHRSESRRYDQILAGDTGETKGPMNVQIRAEDPLGGIAVWGFATTRTTPDSPPRLVSVDFYELSPPLAVP